MGKNKTKIDNGSPEWNPEETIDLEITGEDVEVADGVDDGIGEEENTKTEAPVAVTNPDPTMDEVIELLPEIEGLDDAEMQIHLHTELSKLDVHFNRTGCMEQLGMQLANLRVSQQAE